MEQRNQIKVIKIFDVNHIHNCEKVNLYYQLIDTYTISQLQPMNKTQIAGETAYKITYRISNKVATS